MRQLVESELKKTGLGYRKLGEIIGVSYGTISAIMGGHVPTTTKTLDRFAKYFGVTVGQLRGEHVQTSARETLAVPHIPPKVERLVQLADGLKPDELATLERCAEAFRANDPEIRDHLIRQLKLLERLTDEAPPPPKEKKTNSF